MAKLGFGTYRCSIESDTHFKALKHAIDLGCEVIDTSRNYTGGDSEKLIAKVLKETKKKPLLISKAGYIQGDLIEELSSKFPEDLVHINEGLMHSIHPKFLEDQLSRSLDSLGVDSIDVYLLHNPEYYLKTEGSTKKEYYSRIKKALIFLEKKVKEGKIKSYGISSNTFVEPKEDHLSTDIDIVMKQLKEIESHSFKYIQFPFNLIEMGALERQFDGEHLFERANHYNLKTIVNRPLNAFLDNGLLRLSNYITSPKLTDSFAEEVFIEKTKSIHELWEKEKEQGDETIYEIPLFKQISTLWYKQNSKDAVDQIFFTHFFPFVASIWGKDLTKEESQPFYELYELAQSYSEKNMNKRAESFKQTAINQGLLFESDKDLSLMAIEKYFMFGADIVLLGMRRKEYVDKVKEYFTL
jgi:aryl-alcohol dehydrogenase-like predicted oxidoreductase